MKEQYIKQVKKELHLPRNRKTEVLRDLNEIFTSTLEHGETESQVIKRLGTPKEFADSTAEQFGIDNTAPQRRKKCLQLGLRFSFPPSLSRSTLLPKAEKHRRGQSDKQMR